MEENNNNSRQSWRDRHAAAYAQRWPNARPRDAYVAGALAADRQPDPKTVAAMKRLAELPASVRGLYSLRLMKQPDGTWMGGYFYGGYSLCCAEGDIHDVTLRLKEAVENIEAV